MRSWPCLHPPAPGQQRLPHPDARPQPATAPIRSGASRCAVVPVAPGVTTTPASGVRRRPGQAGARSHGHARHSSPAAVTASRHLSNISVTVGPLGPAHRSLTTRLMPVLATCSTRFGEGAGPRHRHWHGACDAVSTCVIMGSATALPVRECTPCYAWTTSRCPRPDASGRRR
jgi:hypothetical protein